MNFSLVSTVFNEARRIEQTIADISNQTLQPSEIIITDAGSTDGTYEILLKWKAQSTIPIIVLQIPGCNVAAGRNAAIKASSTNLIASTDFGCRFHPQWLESIISPFANPAVNVVGGAYTVKEADQVTIAAKAAYILAKRYTLDYHAPGFIPSSRSIAFKKDVFNTVGGYCEWLTLAADDTVFGLEIKANGYEITIVDKPYVYWGRHEALSSYAKEAYRYGLGDGEANVNYSVLFKVIFILALFYLLGTCIILLFLGLVSSLVPAVIPAVIILGIVTVFYFTYIIKWFKLKSSKYDFKTMLFGFRMLYKQKVNYIKGYIKGRFYSSDSVRQNSVLLNKRLRRTR